MYFKSSYKIFTASKSFLFRNPFSIKWQPFEIFAKLNENGLALDDSLQLRKYQT